MESRSVFAWEWGGVWGNFWDENVFYFDWSNGFTQVNKSVKTHLTLHLKWELS